VGPGYFSRGSKMSIVDQVGQAFFDAARNQNTRGLKVAALLLTEAQELALRENSHPCHWEYVPRRDVLRYNGATVITVPEGVFYTPRVLMGDH